MGEGRLALRVDEETLRALDRRARETGMSRSALIRDYVRGGLGFNERVEPLSPDQLVRLLERHATAGSVKATELLLMRPWERKPAEPPQRPRVDALTEIDELARRRGG